MSSPSNQSSKHQWLIGLVAVPLLCTLIAVGAQIWTARKTIAKNEVDAVRQVMDTLIPILESGVKGEAMTVVDRRSMLHRILEIDASKCPSDFRDVWFTMINAGNGYLKELEQQPTSVNTPAAEIQFRKALDDMLGIARKYIPE